MMAKLDNIGGLRKVNTLKLIHFVLSAWKLITPSVIGNCFQKVRFLDGESIEDIKLGIKKDWKTLEKEKWISLYPLRSKCQ